MAASSGTGGGAEKEPRMTASLRGWKPVPGEHINIEFLFEGGLN